MMISGGRVELPSSLSKSGVLPLNDPELFQSSSMSSHAMTIGTYQFTPTYFFEYSLSRDHTVDHTGHAIFLFVNMIEVHDKGGMGCPAVYARPTLQAIKEHS